ncbi:hypothetical protein KCV87_19945 [Actinosynnema pretiosum subsp. pretiosum]|uniref:Uncharacterized protein n=1 Tax=Actinosynnema pretiosum subsp. pretiosum TaxID=103721 RepID=A0AA45R1V1_9PSEU|nr:hypothetical protein KCV87_19945 [Actinosynnema pretiosum subsp. pretiosum]
MDGPHGTPVLDRIAKLREELPPPVVPGKGQKTDGRWFDGNGAVRDSVSGKDADSEEAWRLLRESGIPLPRPPVVAHAEMKVAAAMRRLNVRHAVLVITNVPCDERWSCENLLPAVLPVGCSLSVHGPGYQRTFHGRTPKW